MTIQAEDFADLRVRYKQVGKEPDERFDSYVITGRNPRTGKRERYLTFDAANREYMFEVLKSKGMTAP